MSTKQIANLSFVQKTHSPELKDAPVEIALRCQDLIEGFAS